MPTNYDFVYGYWHRSNSGFTTYFSANEAYGYNYQSTVDGGDLHYVGITPDYIKSGIGYSTDLLVKIDSRSTRQFRVFDKLESNIASVLVSNTNPAPVGGSEAATGLVND